MSSNDWSGSGKCLLGKVHMLVKCPSKVLLTSDVLSHSKQHNLRSVLVLDV